MKCKQIINNKQCEANAMKNSNFCYLHNPNISDEEKQSAQSKGGQNRSLKIYQPLLPIEINSAKDITKLLTETINQVREGNLDCRIANTIGFLAGITLKAFEISSLEERINKIESTINNSD